MCSEREKVAKKERLDIVQNRGEKILAGNSPFNVQVKKNPLYPPKYNQIAISVVRDGYFLESYNPKDTLLYQL